MTPEMDFISSTNLFSITSYDINTKFNHRCQSDWGGNNFIAFVSLDGIYILKLQPENQIGPFDIQLIRNPTTKFNLAAKVNDIGPTFDEKWSTLDNNQYMQVFLDPALANHVSKLSPDLYPRRYRMAKWSPVIESYPKECILAALTTDYQLLIFARKNSTWMMADLIPDFDTYPNINHSKDQSFNAVRRQLHSFSFCNICWYKQAGGNILLLASSILGDIFIWRLIVASGRQDGLNSHRYSFIVQTSLTTRIEYITSMQIKDDLLIVASRRGLVVFYDLTSIQLSECSLNYTGKQQVVETAILEPTATLWYEDDIEVLDFYLQSTRENTYNIVLSKSTNICWSTMNYVKNSTDNKSTLSINDSFSAIDVSSPATWIRPSGNNRAAFIADDGSFFQVEFPLENPDKNPDFEVIRTGRIDLTRMVPRGLCTSHRGKLIAMISSISLLYEPSKIVAPTKVTIVPTENDSKSLMDCLGKLLDESWLESERVCSTMDVHDSIDYIRLFFPALDYEQSLEMLRYLRETIASIGYPNNDNQLVKLKISSFLLSNLTNLVAENSDSEQERMEQNLFNNILSYYVRQVLLVLSQRSQVLSQDQVNSLRNYRRWLKTVPNGKQLIDSFGGQFKELDGDKYAGVTGELCSICQAQISFEQVKYGTCASGHRYARCARSLLIVDLQKADKLSCEHCQRHYLAHLVWPMPANLWPCIFCQ